ncbi:dipeptidase [Coprinopsis marcescibilis]|uniref:Dipeptidase n=1 Tax=Coprinopsis marcescibilis TaxID=230819 RepID=A0A5C3KYC7_COPMA|nr:dipeptidase [Coprinopsis marcescibilis]
MARSRSNSSSSSSSSSSDGSKASKKGGKQSWWKSVAGKGDGASSSSSASEAARAARNAVILGLVQNILPSHSSNPEAPKVQSTHSTISNGSRNESSPLLPTANSNGNNQDHEQTACEANPRVRSIVWGTLMALFAIVLTLILVLEDFHDSVGPWFGAIPKDPVLAALVILDHAPVIDGHIDLPILVRGRFANNVSAIDMEGTLPGHVDIPRLRKGKVGGFFWSAYVSCPKNLADEKDFVNATWRVRDTLEQIDVAKLLIEKYPHTFQLALTAKDIETAVLGKKIAGLIGIEGGHQLGNSLAVLRQYHALGVRYVTLTHTCHNAFADSGGFLKPIPPLHDGLSPFGITLIEEMNRLGVLVDLSHTSDATARQALQFSKAPVIWSHSSARAVHNVARNVPDDILRLLGSGEGQADGVVMVNFAPFFVAAPGEANVDVVANHVEHIAKVAGKAHVGIGSDFDGIDSVPVGLEDVSKYPALIAELYRRGWNKFELAGLTGGNLLRVLKKAEKVAHHLQVAGTQPKYDIYEKRTDIPRQFDAL